MRRAVAPAQAAALAGRAELRGILLVLLAMLVFGCMDGIAKQLLVTLSAPQVLWVRYLLSVPLVLALAARTGGASLWRTGRPGLQVLRSLIIVIEMLLVMAGFAVLQLADVHAILAATPLVVTALSVPLLKEQVGWRRWLAVSIGCLGVLVIVRPGLTVISPGALYVMAATVLYALYQILTRVVGRTDRAETSLAFQFVVGAIALSFVGPFFWVEPTGLDWAMMAAIAGMGSAGHLFLTRALQLSPAVVLQPFTYTLLLWAVVIGYLAFGDLPDAATLAGAALVVVAGIYTAVRQHRLRAVARSDY